MRRGLLLSLALAGSASAGPSWAQEPGALGPATAGAGQISPGTAAGYGALSEIQSCPYRQIRAAYDEAVSGKDVLDTLAVEREILVLCEERNSLVATLLAGEEELARLLGRVEPEVGSSAAPQGLSVSGTRSAAPEVTLAVPLEADSRDDVTAASGSSPAPSVSPSLVPSLADIAAEVRSALTAVTTDAVPPDPASDAGAVVATADTLDGAGPASDLALSLADQPVAAPAVPAAALQCRFDYATRFTDIGGTEPIAGVVDAAGGTRIVRPGAKLAGGYTVARIDADGVVLWRDGLDILLPPATEEPPLEPEGFVATPVVARDTGAPTSPAPGLTPPTLPVR